MRVDLAEKRPSVAQHLGGRLRPRSAPDALAKRLPRLLETAAEAALDLVHQLLRLRA